MNTTLALRPVHGPGLGWLPSPLRRAATWRTAGRWLLFGPLIGGLPYNVFLLPVPFSFLIGGLPAALAGLLFGLWLHAGPAPRWPWRVLVGALAGAAAAAASAVFFVLLAGRPSWFMPAVIALHGVPAAALLAAWPERPTSSSKAA